MKNYDKLSLKEKRELYSLLLNVFSKEGLTIKEADKKIISLSLDEKLKLVNK